MCKTINFLGIKLSVLTKNQIADKICEFALSKKRRMITYLNANCSNIAFEDNNYKKILNQMDMVYAGGQGIVLATRLLGSPLPGRVNILDFFDLLTEKLTDKGITIYLLGGEKSVVKTTAQTLKEKGIKIIGYSDGFFNKFEEQRIIQEVNRLNPDILIVGMGAPKQEKWIYEHLNELNVHLCWGVGAAFEWLSGLRKRAPRCMIVSGFEWLHRLYQEPRRLWKRYLVGNLTFIYRIIKFKLLKVI